MQNINSTNNRFLLLYGSQTGQAEAISEELRDRARLLGLNPDFHSMKDDGKSFSLERETLAVFALSTTGDGEVPDTAQKFIRRLKKRTLEKDFLKNLRYCLLALGDSNYLNFCNCGKQFDKRLRELGAQQFQETSYADDAVGLEVAAEPWLDRTLEYLVNFFKIEPNPVSSSQLKMSSIDENAGSNITLAYSSAMENLELNVPPLQQSYIIVEYQQETELSPKLVPLQNNLAFPTAVSEVFPVHITKAKQLTNSASVKEYIQLWFQLPDKDISYRPGDAFGFVPRNNDTEVDEILSLLGLQDKADLTCCLMSQENGHKIPSHLPSCSTLRLILLTCCDIRSPPKKAMLRAIAEYTTNPIEKRRLLELCSRQGSAEFMEIIRAQNISLLDILKTFPTCCNTPIVVFLENLTRLQARFYSVANSPLGSPGAFTTVFSVINFQAGSGRSHDRTGVCTGFLKCAAELLLDQHNDDPVENLTAHMRTLNTEVSSELLIFKRKSSNFVLPEDHTIPLIMIGTGAGVAPFLGFLSHRLEIQKQNSEQSFGETWLYFGCRQSKHDFLFEKEFQDLKRLGILSHFKTAFSRNPDSSRLYVQDRLTQDMLVLLDLIATQKAIVFVCGDAKNMGKDVSKAFVKGYETAKSVTTTEAEQWLLCLQKEKQYIQDLWI